MKAIFNQGPLYINIFIKANAPGWIQSAEGTVIALIFVIMSGCHSIK